MKFGYLESAGTNIFPSTCPQKCLSVLYNTQTTFPYGIKCSDYTFLNNYYKCDVDIKS